MKIALKVLFSCEMLSKMFLATESLRLRISPDGKVNHNIKKEFGDKTACIIGTRIPRVGGLPHMLRTLDTLDVKVKGLVPVGENFMYKYSFMFGPSYIPGTYTLSKQDGYEKCVVINNPNPEEAFFTFENRPATLLDDMVLDLVVFSDLPKGDGDQRMKVIREEMKKIREKMKNDIEISTSSRK